MKYGLYLNEVLMEKFETEREAYKAADFANSETGVTHHVKMMNDTSKWNEVVEYVLGKSQRIVDGRIVYDGEAIKVLESAGVSINFTGQGVRWTLN